VKGMVGALEPVHLPALKALHGALHELAPAKLVARAIEAEHRHPDRREVSDAQLFGLSGRMQRIGKQQHAVAFEAVRGEHRGGAAAHGAATDDEFSPSPHFRRNLGNGLFEDWHGIGPLRALLPVRKVEPHHVHTHGLERLGDGRDAAVGHVAARAVRADERRDQTNAWAGRGAAGRR